jgi:ribosomal protein S6--L-glutamate ligase
VRIALITQRKDGDAKSHVKRELEEALVRHGASVTTIHPEDAPIDVEAVAVEHDLYLLKSGTVAAAALAGLLHESGARIVPTYPAYVRMRDKVTATKVLADAGIPQPRTYLASTPGQLAGPLELGPLVVKPHRGSQGRGVSIVRTPEELAALPSDGQILFAQEYRPPEGRDHKIYRIGDDYFGVMRVFPARTYEEKLGEPFEVSGALREMADRCGRAFGVDLFGLDVIVSGGEPVVIDVNTFPGFKGVPNAGSLLADYIVEKLRAV